jgi:hypothetical protein
MTANMSSPQDTPPPSTPLRVEDVMRKVRDDVTRERRRRLLARGASHAYRDPEMFASVEDVLRRSLEDRPKGGLMLPDLLSDEQEWLLDDAPFRFTSHRKVLGPLIVFLKRRIVLPMTRWLFEYLVDNLRRQHRINRLLFACVEELAIENARLRQDVQRPEQDRSGSAAVR